MNDMEFENGFQALLSLSGTPENIDHFTLLYKILLISIKEISKPPTLAEIQECRVRGSRLKQLLLKQFGYVKGLKDEAMVDEFETIDNDTGAKA